MTDEGETVKPKFTTDELMALGRLAGYTQAEVARMLLDADEKRDASAERVAEAALAIQLDPGPYHSTYSASLFVELEEALDAWRPGWRS